MVADVPRRYFKRTGVYSNGHVECQSSFGWQQEDGDCSSTQCGHRSRSDARFAKSLRFLLQLPKPTPTLHRGQWPQPPALGQRRRHLKWLLAFLTVPILLLCLPPPHPAINRLKNHLPSRAKSPRRNQAMNLPANPPQNRVVNCLLSLPANPP